MQNVARRAFCGACATLALGLPLVANAQPSLAALGALLIDIPGWQGEKPDTMNASHGGITVSYAARRYEQGEKQIMTMLGRSGLEQQAQMAGGGRQGDFSMETEGTSLRSRTIRGFRVFTAYNGTDKDGLVLVYLSTNGATTFVLQFEGITLDDALTHAQRFDWTAMQRTVGGR